MKKRATLLACIASLSLVLLPFSRLWSQDLDSGGSDISAPKVQHLPSAEAAPAGKPFAISASVTDDVAVTNVQLYYRTKGAESYSQVPMNKVGAGDVYMANIPGAEISEPGVEYYIEASDTAGNTILRGFSFSPLVVSVGLPAAGSTPSEPPTGAKEPAKKKTNTLTYILIGLGAAALIGAASGGGGSSGNDNPEPATGTVDVTAPVPQ